MSEDEPEGKAIPGLKFDQISIEQIEESLRAASAKVREPPVVQAESSPETQSAQSPIDDAVAAAQPLDRVGSLPQAAPPVFGIAQDKGASEAGCAESRQQGEKRKTLSPHTKDHSPSEHATETTPVAAPEVGESIAKETGPSRKEKKMVSSLELDRFAHRPSFRDSSWLFSTDPGVPN
uniref:Uncharacterized protein n=1 Tax=Chromera velia CCMP2878 TaxID=1169474 RepID=A0A0G4H039_9ALVE|eukprot:Cvel_24082.t1-p1 / transcript=Cvel_24082.t1 / gene=Cvel_24082 / organism=Chromera_velia_CCMP2878 / gene_product=hypothetical protein / transcript_product=hypothetical protein / location=Cvel_scaffold2566:1757-3169(+) / protein_length=177 / sequence_SO=supercontig / SO=protein_coding / is_pseudo=false